MKTKISQEAYDMIEDIINRNVETRWVSANYQIRCITSIGITRIKEEIKERLLEEQK